MNKVIIIGNVLFKLKPLNNDIILVLSMCCVSAKPR